MWMIEWIVWRWRRPCMLTNLQPWLTWSSQQGGNSYEEMKKKLCDPASLSKITVVSDWLTLIPTLIDVTCDYHSCNVSDVINFNVTDLSLNFKGFLTNAMYRFDLISQLPLSYHQDLNNTNLSKSPVGSGGGGYRALGGPVSSPTLYRVHGGDQSPRPSTPTSPSTQRVQSSVSLNMSPSASFSPPSPSAGGSGTSLDPALLINKSPSELPKGVDPSQREVGAGFWIWCKWHHNMEMIMCEALSVWMYLPKPTKSNVILSSCWGTATFHSNTTTLHNIIGWFTVCCSI